MYLNAGVHRWAKMDHMSVEQKLKKLERRYVTTTLLLSVCLIATLVVAVFTACGLNEISKAKTLRVKELRVYDEHGVDRVVIAGHLPQVTLNGKTRTNFKPRDMGGILIYDASGTERGGYGTSDGYANAMLTLDSGAKADGKQVMLLLAEPEGGAFFRQWDGTGSVTTGVYGKPFVTVMDGKTVVFAKPEDNAWTKRGIQ